MVRQKQWDTRTYTTTGKFVPAFGRELISLLQLRPGAKVLDLGCGDGSLTASIPHITGISNLSISAIDTSSALLTAARARGLDVRQLDAQHLPFNNEFDAIFSNAALHWMPDSAAVFASVFRALRPGGTFVAEFGGAANIFQVRRALRRACIDFNINYSANELTYFRTSQLIGKQLAAAKLKLSWLQHFRRTTPVITGITDWLTTFADYFANSLSAARQQDFYDRTAYYAEPFLLWQKAKIIKQLELEAAIQQQSSGSNGLAPVYSDLINQLTSSCNWVIDYVRIRIHAIKASEHSITNNGCQDFA